MTNSFNFSGVEAATGGSYTRPGTIGLFVISKVEFGTSKEKQTAYMQLTFQCTKLRNDKGELVDEGSTFSHKFYMTAGALKRVQYLAKVMFDQEFDGEITDVALINKFLNKSVALKVTGQVSDKGKGYADLSYAGFAMKADEFSSDPTKLNFSAAERALVEDALEAISHSTPGNADSEQGSGAPAPTGTAPKKAF